MSKSVCGTSTCALIEYSNCPFWNSLVYLVHPKHVRFFLSIFETSGSNWHIRYPIIGTVKKNLRKGRISFPPLIQNSSIVLIIKNCSRLLQAMPRLSIGKFHCDSIYNFAAGYIVSWILVVSGVHALSICIHMQRQQHLV